MGTSELVLDNKVRRERVLTPILSKSTIKHDLSRVHKPSLTASSETECEEGTTSEEELSLGKEGGRLSGRSGGVRSLELNLKRMKLLGMAV